MRLAVRLLLAVALLTLGFVTGLRSAMGFPTEVVVVGKRAVTTECGTTYYVTYRDKNGEQYPDQVEGPGAWSALVVGDRVPATWSWSGNLLSIDVMKPKH